MAEQRLVSVAKAERLARAALRRFGTPDPIAGLVAARLLEADLAGYPSHGVMRIPEYCMTIDAKRLAPQARPTRTRISPVAFTIDGRRAFGALVADEIIATATEHAPDGGFLAIGVRRSGHLGWLGYIARAVAGSGWILMGFFNCSGGGQRVVPFGGADGRLATNPIVFGFPVRDGTPVVVDLATSAWSDGAVRIAAARGERLPHGVLADYAGHPVDDAGTLDAKPPAALLLPMGGIAAHKGYALAVAVEILAGIIGSPESVANQHSETGNSGMLLLLSPSILGRSQAEIDNDVAALEEYLRACSMDERQPVRLPGRRSRNGGGPPPATTRIQVPARVWDEITRLAGLGVQP
jgi:LDH2 family malate/lactate/ureidoglycolate dehydrogenase